MRRAVDGEVDVKWTLLEDDAAAAADAAADTADADASRGAAAAAPPPPLRMPAHLRALRRANSSEVLPIPGDDRLI